MNRKSFLRKALAGLGIAAVAPKVASEVSHLNVHEHVGLLSGANVSVDTSSFQIQGSLTGGGDLKADTSIVNPTTLLPVMTKAQMETSIPSIGFTCKEKESRQVYVFTGKYWFGGPGNEIIKPKTT